jgi:hypothetical protein
MTTTGAAILGRLIAPDEPTLTPEAARSILVLTFSQADRDRILALAAKNQAGDLTVEERAELEEYIRADDFLCLLKSKARHSLRKAGLGPGTG